jgi:hypothetical protein
MCALKLSFTPICTLVSLDRVVMVEKSQMSCLWCIVAAYHYKQLHGIQKHNTDVMYQASFGTLQTRAGF